MCWPIGSTATCAGAGASPRPTSSSADCWRSAISRSTMSATPRTSGPDKHAALAGASPTTRREVAKVLLDFMRRSLAIKVDYLERTAQERMQQLSSQKLKPPWGLDENETLDYAAVLYPGPQRGNNDDRENIYLSPRGGFGQYLGRRTTFPERLRAA